MKKVIRLDNGLRILLVQNKQVRSVSLGVYVKCGSQFETPEINGASHFIEHMLFKGTNKRSAFDIANDIDKIGASINAYTAKNHTCFYTLSLDENVEACMEVLSDMFFNSTFDATEFNRERKVILEEINECEDDPEDKCYETLSNITFKNNSLERPILGTPEILNTFTNQTLIDFKNKYYNAHNTVICAVGNITEEKIVDLVNKYFVFTDTAHDIEYGIAPDYTISTGYKAISKDIEQVHIALSFPGFKYGSYEANTLTLFSTLFGVNMSSRLFQSIREKLGLCYSITSGQNNFENCGAFAITTSTNKKNYEKAIFAIKDEIEKVIDEGLTEDELQMGKQQIKTAIVLSEESTSGIMRLFGRHMMLTNELYDFDKKLRDTDSITQESLKETIRKVFDFNRVNLSIVGKDVEFDINKIK